MNTLLRDLSIQYIEDYMKLVNSEEVHKTTQPGEEFCEFSREQIEKWLNSLAQKDDRKDFAIIEENTDSFVGEVILNHIQNQSANLRIAILPKFFNRGHGTDAVRQAVAYGFEVLLLNKITLDVYTINPRGIRVYEKCGFKEVSIKEEPSGIKEIHMEILAQR